MQAFALFISIVAAEGTGAFDAQQARDELLQNAQFLL